MVWLKVFMENLAVVRFWSAFEASPRAQANLLKAPADGSMATLKSSESSFNVLTGTRDYTRDNRSAKTPTQSVQLSKYFRLRTSDQLVGCGLSPDRGDQHSGDSLQKTETGNFAGSKEEHPIWKISRTTRTLARYILVRILLSCKNS